MWAMDSSCKDRKDMSNRISMIYCNLSAKAELRESGEKKRCSSTVQWHGMQEKGKNRLKTPLHLYGMLGINLLFISVYFHVDV